MKTLNKIQVRNLLMALPKVAKCYYDGKMQAVELEMGMCWGVKQQYAAADLHNTAYHDLGDLLNEELGFANRFYLENVQPSRDNWEQRAIMCLFLAEFLKGEM